MEGRKLTILLARAFQLLFAAVVLGLSVSLAAQISTEKEFCDEENHGKAQKLYCNAYGFIPAIRFCAFVGAFGLIDGLVGLASAFFDAIPYLATAVLDGLADLFYLAGGVRLAVLLKQSHCTGKDCGRVKSDSAFLFLGFLVTLALIGMGFFFQRRGSGKMHSAV